MSEADPKMKASSPSSPMMLKFLNTLRSIVMRCAPWATFRKRRLRPSSVNVEYSLGDPSWMDLGNVQDCSSDSNIKQTSDRCQVSYSKTQGYATRVGCVRRRNDETTSVASRWNQVLRSELKHTPTGSKHKSRHCIRTLTKLPIDVRVAVAI